MVAYFLEILGDHQIIDSLLTAILRTANDLDQFFFCFTEQLINYVVIPLYLLRQTQITLN